MESSNDTTSTRDAHLNRGVMSWTHFISIILLSFPFLFFLGLGIYLTSCSNGTLNPAYSHSWHTLPTAYSSFPIPFRFTPQRAFHYWLAFYLVTFRSTYICHQRLILLYTSHVSTQIPQPSAGQYTVQSNSLSSLISIDRRPSLLRLISRQA